MAPDNWSHFSFDRYSLSVAQRLQRRDSTTYNPDGSTGR